MPGGEHRCPSHCQSSVPAALLNSCLQVQHHVACRFSVLTSLGALTHMYTCWKTGWLHALQVDGVLEPGDKPVRVGYWQAMVRGRRVDLIGPHEPLYGLYQVHACPAVCCLPTDQAQTHAALHALASPCIERAPRLISA